MPRLNKRAQTEWIHKSLIFQKQNQAARFLAADFILNAVTKRDPYLLQYIKKRTKFLDKSANTFTSNADKGYQGVEIDEGDHNKTAFASYHGRQRFVLIYF